MKLQKGFTLIEYIIVIVLFSIIGLMAVMVLQQTFKAYFTGKNISDLAIKTSVATQTILRDLKNAQSVSAIAANSITFSNQKGQTVVFDLNGANLRQNINSGGAYTLCNQVSNLGFAFFDQTFTTTAVAGNVRFITIQLTTTNNGYSYSLMGATVLRKLLP